MEFITWSILFDGMILLVMLPRLQHTSLYELRSEQVGWWLTISWQIYCNFPPNLIQFQRSQRQYTLSASNQSYDWNSLVLSVGLFFLPSILWRSKEIMRKYITWNESIWDRVLVKLNSENNRTKKNKHIRIITLFIANSSPPTSRFEISSAIMVSHALAKWAVGMSDLTVYTTPHQLK